MFVARRVAPALASVLWLVAGCVMEEMSAPPEYSAQALRSLKEKVPKKVTGLFFVPREIDPAPFTHAF